jgi:eukaryotic-like serine/threonine-protein kinase
VTEPEQFKFRAFLSYGHRDRKWGQRLYAALERCPIEEPGAMPKSILPIYRNCADSPAGHSLVTSETHAALADSEFLIVLCSPNAAKSYSIDDVVRRFKARGGAERTIAVIVDGKPGDPRECFPPALRFKVDADARLTDEREAPFTIDVQAESDEKIAAQRVAARLLGLGEALPRSTEEPRQARKPLRPSIAWSSLALLVAATAALLYFWLINSPDRLDRAVESAASLAIKASSAAARLGAPPRLTTGLLAGSETALTWLIDNGTDAPELRYRKALALFIFADGYEKFGLGDEWTSRIAPACSLLTALIDQAPEKLASQRERAVACERAGNKLVAGGTLDQGLAGYRAALAIAEHLPAGDRDDGRSQRHVFVLHIKIADVLLAQGAFNDALQSTRAGLAIIQQLAASDAGNLDWQRDLAMSYAKLGDVLVAGDSVEEARGAYRSGIAIMAGLTAANPKNVQWQVDATSLQWRLAAVGDDPARRFALIVTTLAGLNAENKLTPEQAEWLVKAKQQLARFQAR